MKKPMDLIYLASPYKHPSKQVMEERYHDAIHATAWLMKKGHVVYSPIVHNHPISEIHALPKGWGYWERYDNVLLRKCDALIILGIDGWEYSEGVQCEERIAQKLHLPIQMMYPSSEGYTLMPKMI